MLAMAFMQYYRRRIGTGQKKPWTLPLDFYTLIQNFIQYGIIDVASYCMEYFQRGATSFSL
jgi:hypothetical protein